MPTSSATDRVTQIANGIATVLDATSLFQTGLTFEKRMWSAGLPGYMIWWDGWEPIATSATPSQSLVRANMETRLTYTVTLAVRLGADEQITQEALRSLSAATVNALWNDKTLAGKALRSAAMGGKTRVYEEGENKYLELPVTVLAEFAGSW